MLTWPRPPSEWVVHVVSPDSVTTTVATYIPRTASYTRRLNAGGSFTTTDDGDLGLLVDGHPVRLLERRPDGTQMARAAGIVQGQEVERNEDGAVLVTRTCPDPFAANVEHDTLNVIRTYTGQPQNTIMRDLVSSAADGSVGLGNGLLAVGFGFGSYFVPGGPLRDRTYPVGKNYGEAIRQLAEIIDGSYFRIDPIPTASLSAPTYSVARFVPGGPEPGVPRPVAALGYGPGTLGNVARYRLTRQRPVTKVRALGSGDPAVTVLVTDVPGRDLYGAHERVLSLADVSVPATLTEHAQQLLLGQDDYGLQLEMVPPAPGGPYAPLLPDDFDVGDSLPVNLPEYTGWAYCTEATVSVDEDGYPALSAITLVTQPERARNFRPPTYAGLGMLAEHERRLRNLET